jgi:hypothetical protein
MPLSRLAVWCNVEYRGFQEVPTYPALSTKIGDLSCQRRALVEGINVYWRVTSDDGAFPPETGQFAQLQIKVN